MCLWLLKSMGPYSMGLRSAEEFTQPIHAKSVMSLFNLTTETLKSDRSGQGNVSINFISCIREV